MSLATVTSQDVVRGLLYLVVKGTISAATLNVVVATAFELYSNAFVWPSKPLFWWLSESPLLREVWTATHKALVAVTVPAGAQLESALDRGRPMWRVLLWSRGVIAARDPGHHDFAQFMERHARRFAEPDLNPLLSWLLQYLRLHLTAKWIVYPQLLVVDYCDRNDASRAAVPVAQLLDEVRQLIAKSGDGSVCRVAVRLPHGFDTKVLPAEALPLIETRVGKPTGFWYAYFVRTVVVVVLLFVVGVLVKRWRDPPVAKLARRLRFRRINKRKPPCVSTVSVFLHDMSTLLSSPPGHTTRHTIATTALEASLNDRNLLAPSPVVVLQGEVGAGKSTFMEWALRRLEVPLDWQLRLSCDAGLAANLTQLLAKETEKPDRVLDPHELLDVVLEQRADSIQCVVLEDLDDAKLAEALIAVVVKRKMQLCFVTTHEARVADAIGATHNQVFVNVRNCFSRTEIQALAMLHCPHDGWAQAGCSQPALDVLTRTTGGRPFVVDRVLRIAKRRWRGAVSPLDLATFVKDNFPSLANDIAAAGYKTTPQELHRVRLRELEDPHQQAAYKLFVAGTAMAFEHAPVYLPWIFDGATERMPNQSSRDAFRQCLIELGMVPPSPEEGAPLHQIDFGRDCVPQEWLTPENARTDVEPMLLRAVEREAARLHSDDGASWQQQSHVVAVAQALMNRGVRFPGGTMELMGVFHIKLGEPQKALPILQQLKDGAHTQGDESKIHRFQYLIASQLSAKGDFEAAAELFASIPIDSECGVQAMAAAAEVYGRLGDRSRALSMLQDVLTRTPMEDPMWLVYRFRIAKQHMFLKDYPLALSTLEEVIETRRRSDGRPNLDELTLKAQILGHLSGRVGEALNILQTQVLPAQQVALKPGHADLMKTNVMIAQMLGGLRRWPEAINILRDPTLTEGLPAGHPDIFDVRYVTAQQYSAMGDLPSALGVLQTAMPPGNYPDIARYQRAIADLRAGRPMN